MDEIDEVLNIQQRQARKMIMRRYQNKIERAKELAQKRMAPDKNIKKRAYAEARQIVRKRFAGKKGAEYEKLGPSEKISIDRAIEKKQDLIKRIALRLIPRVKAAEQKRLQSFVKGHALMNTGAPEGHSKVNESFMLFAEKFDTESEKAKLDTGPNDGKTKTTKSKSKNPEIKYYNKFGEQTIDALDRKSEKSGIDIEILGEVYNRGLDAWNDHPKVTREQYAFARVNSFINKGKSYYAEDADLVEETVEEGKRGLWDNIHAKRKRIKAGSGERMRKPGSKGAPTEKSLKDAQESVEIDEAEMKGKDPCWKGYQMVGKKTKNGKEVPNCVPESVEIDEGVDKNHPIVKEYNALKKHDIKTLRNMISQHHKVVDTSEFKTKDHAVSHYLRQKHGNKKVDQAFGFNEETELDEAGSKYNIPMARTKSKSAPTRTFIGVVDELGIPAKHLDRARSVWNRTKDVDAVKKFVSSVKEETELDEQHSVHIKTYDKHGEKQLASKEFKSHLKSHGGEFHYGTDKGVAFKFGSAHHADSFHRGVMTKFRDLGSEKDVHESIEESNNTPYVKPHIEKGSTKQSGWKASNKHGRVKYFGMDFKKSAEKHAGISEEVEELDELSKKTIKSYLDKSKEGGKDYPTSLSFRRSMEAQGIAKAKLGKSYKRRPLPDVKIKATNEEVELDEKLTSKTPMSTYIKDFQKSDAPQFKGKSLEKRRQMAIAAKLANEDCDCSDKRKKIENVDRPPATKGVRTKQGEIQKKIIDESKDLNESFNIALATGVGVTLTAADLGMRAQGGFALHPSVIAEIEQRQIKEDAESALKKPVYMPPRRREDGSYGPAKTVLRKTGKKIIDNTPEIDADSDPHDGQ